MAGGVRMLERELQRPPAGGIRSTRSRKIWTDLVTKISGSSVNAVAETRSVTYSRGRELTNSVDHAAHAWARSNAGGLVETVSNTSVD
jgi:hypothetical protein